jgi:hypothetical protein
MTLIDPIAERVVCRYLAARRVQAAALGRRVAIEYQRRRHGLEPVAERSLG